MDIKQIRLRNLRMLIVEAGTIANLARLSSTAPAYLSQILNSLPTSTGRPRSVGDKLARKLESAMDKPYGWMDQGSHDASESTSAPGDMVRYVPRIEEPEIVEYIARPIHEMDKPGDTVPVPIVLGSDSFALRISTDAMEPKFLNGDIIVIDPDVQVRPQDFVLVLDKTSSTVTFRQLIEDGTHRYLKPLNPNYPLLELQNQHRIIGKVVYRGEIL
jgi:SOS-response transcriptional repressor LexA